MRLYMNWMLKFVLNRVNGVSVKLDRLEDKDLIGLSNLHPDDFEAKYKQYLSEGWLTHFNAIQSQIELEMEKR